MEKTVERAAVGLTFLPADLASCSRSLTFTSCDDLDAVDISTLISEAASGFTGVLDPTWAFAFARENG